MTTKEKATYVVDQIEIVSPNDVRVLQPRSVPSLTLVTCYPFTLWATHRIDSSSTHHWHRTS